MRGGSARTPLPHHPVNEQPTEQPGGRSEGGLDGPLMLSSAGTSVARSRSGSKSRCAIAPASLPKGGRGGGENLRGEKQCTARGSVDEVSGKYCNLLDLTPSPACKPMPRAVYLLRWICFVIWITKPVRREGALYLPLVVLVVSVSIQRQAALCIRVVLRVAVVR